jgi:hypothetical protein
MHLVERQKRSTTLRNKFTSFGYLLHRKQQTSIPTSRTRNRVLAKATTLFSPKSCSEYKTRAADWIAYDDGSDG